jgi:hypothetical protein
MAYWLGVALSPLTAAGAGCARRLAIVNLPHKLGNSLVPLAQQLRECQGCRGTGQTSAACQNMSSFNCKICAVYPFFGVLLCDMSCGGIHYTPTIQERFRAHAVHRMRP